MRALVIAGLAIGCTPAPTTSPAAAPVTGPTPVATPEPTPLPEGVWYVGVLGQRGEPECPGGEQRWVDVEPMIGWAPTHALSDEESKWLDRPVVAHGRAGTAPAPRVTTTVTAPCPTPQKRSDWVFTPRGLRISRGGSGAAIPEFFTRDSLRPLAELTVTPTGDQLVIDFRNPVPVALTDVEIRVHYEGCQGKPDTLHREHAVGSLAVAAGVQASFPGIAEGHRGAHRAQSVQIIAHGTDVTFDLDVALAALGAPVKCPERE